MALNKKNWKPEFRLRFERHEEELRWLYFGIYNNNRSGYEWLCNSLYEYYKKRSVELKRIDQERLKSPDWYKGNDILGMMMYTELFAKNIKGIRDHLDYIESCGVNYLHLMPLLDSPVGKDDGGYAVSDFRKVKPELGTMEDLRALTSDCHKKGISCCLDFVMNHTSDEHAWAKAARAGDRSARSRYFFYDNWDIPNQYDRTVPQVFPTTAPGNFTWLSDCNQVVMTTFYPFQWDLNYGNQMVFNDMVGNMLYLANQGIDIIRLDAVPYIWKKPGTRSRNLPEVHTLVRMMRMISEIVCPGVLLLGEVVMEPQEVVPYFGTVEKPECHMLYNVTTMASTWNSIATKNVALLRRQIDAVSACPKICAFLNYLRCHDDIGWGLDYPWLSQFGIEQVPHKKYLNDYFTGKFPGSDSRGELYNDDPSIGDARLCGTTASLCGLEAAEYEKNEDKAKRAIRCILMLHSYLLFQSGIPVLYSGDEIGQLNDYYYKDDPQKSDDSRYLHRGDFRWERLKHNNHAKTIFTALRKMEKLRTNNDIFSGEASVCTINTGNEHILGVRREWNGKILTGFFNFSENPQKLELYVSDGLSGVDLLTGKKANSDVMEGYGAWWILR